MKKVILLLLLSLMAYTYSPQIQNSVRDFSQTPPVKQTLSTFKSFLASGGLDDPLVAPELSSQLQALTALLQNAWQNSLGTTLQVVSGISSDNSTVEKSIRFLEKQLHDQLELSSLPSVNPSGLKEQVSDQISVYAGDAGVTEQTLKTASSLINTYSLSTIRKNTGFNPTGPVTIVLYSTAQGYGDALLKAGIPPQEISAMINQTGGITVNSSIWIPLYNLQGKSDLANVLTHELTHVTFNQAGIGLKLPLWLNEGASWFNGLKTKAQISPIQTKLEIKTMTAGLQKVAQSGKLLPLSQIERGLLSTNYNVEFQGYLATDALIREHGMTAFQNFLHDAKRIGVEKSFLQNFGMSLHDFEKGFKI